MHNVAKQYPFDYLDIMRSEGGHVTKGHMVLDQIYGFVQALQVALRIHFYLVQLNTCDVSFLSRKTNHKTIAARGSQKMEICTPPPAPSSPSKKNDQETGLTFSNASGQQSIKKNQLGIQQPEPRHSTLYRVSESSSSDSTSPARCRSRGEFAHSISSSLVKEPACSLVRALGSALLALHSADQCWHTGSLAGRASIRSTTATERLGDAAEGVVCEVGLGRSGAEAACGALFGGFEAFFDGEELRFESGTIVS